MTHLTSSSSFSFFFFLFLLYFSAVCVNVSIVKKNKEGRGEEEEEEEERASHQVVFLFFLRPLVKNSPECHVWSSSRDFDVLCRTFS